jgi:hypothetical protein
LLKGVSQELGKKMPDWNLDLNKNMKEASQKW